MSTVTLTLPTISVVDQLVVANQSLQIIARGGDWAAPDVDVTIANNVFEWSGSLAAGVWHVARLRWNYAAGGCSEWTGFQFTTDGSGDYGPKSPALRPHPRVYDFRVVVV